MIYIESIKDGAISVVSPQSHKRVDLFKGLNKVDEKIWDECKEMPLMKAYIQAGTVKVSDVKCREDGEKAEMSEAPVQEPVVETISNEDVGSVDELMNDEE